MKESSQDLAALYVLDRLDPAERAAFEARLLGNEPGLAEIVRDLEAGLARGLRSLPAHEAPAGALARIEARLDAPPASAAPVIPLPPRWTGIARWGIAAVIAVSLATLAVQSIRGPAGRPTVVFVSLDAGRNTFAELPLRNGAQDPDARFMQLASLAENFWTKPGEQPLRSGPVSGDNRGYALYDPHSRQGFIAIERLPVITGSQCYQLWIIDPATGRVHDAGRLPRTGSHRGLYSFTLSPQATLEAKQPGFFVTVENTGDAAPAEQPRGKVVLGHQQI